MTQPTSLSKTFDTSLVDVQQSFSSTETNTSGSSGKENTQPMEQPTSSSSGPAKREPSPFRTIPTDQLYEHWASTYDTDGNVLQACDDVQLQSLLPKFVRSTRINNYPAAQTLQILDLGCGTGRNTRKLLQADWDADVNLVGWDVSQAMLEIAKTKCDVVPKSGKHHVSFELSVRDLASVESVPNAYANFFDGLISTLVAEHIPADTFLGIVAKVLKPGAHALITNMHQDLGALSKAGFKTASGERFKATSYIHTPRDILDAANAAGLELVGHVGEMAVDPQLIDGGVVNGMKIEKGFVAERARKYVGTKVWFGMMLRKK
jgi:SAM-dependent methyltransferase